MHYLKFFSTIGLAFSLLGCGGGGSSAPDSSIDNTVAPTRVPEATTPPETASSTTTTKRYTGRRAIYEWAKYGKVLPLLSDYQLAFAYGVTTQEDVVKANKLFRKEQVSIAGVNLGYGPETHAQTASTVNEYLFENGMLPPLIIENEIVWKGLTYGVVTSPYTGRQWLDRNLGAPQICSASRDFKCPGYFFQWGREADGHEKILGGYLLPRLRVQDLSTEFVEKELTESSYDGGEGVETRVIVGEAIWSDWAKGDTDGLKRAAFWSRIDGTSICPVGFRVPTGLEAATELVYAHDEFGDNTKSKDEQLASFLRMGATGSAGGLGGYAEFHVLALDNRLFWTTDYEWEKSQDEYSIKKVMAVNGKNIHASIEDLETYVLKDYTSKLSSVFEALNRTKAAPVRCIKD